MTKRKLRLQNPLKPKFPQLCTPERPNSNVGVCLRSRAPAGSNIRNQTNEEGNSCSPGVDQLQQLLELGSVTGSIFRSRSSHLSSVQTKRCSETSSNFSSFSPNFPLNWRHFILVLWRRGERLYTHFRCRLGRLNAFHMHLFRLNPADLDGEELAVIFPSSAV